MKKIIAILSIIIIVFMSNKTTEDVIIPSESIRIRVVAHSNNSYDQMMKQVVRNNIEKKINDLLMDANNIDEAREIIKNNISLIDESIKKTLNTNDYNVNYNIDLGYHLFPEKKYKGVVYEEGYYESVVITLGEGKGDNWWCVLFPPLCLMESNEEDISEVEYKSFIKELIEKYF